MSAGSLLGLSVTQPASSSLVASSRDLLWQPRWPDDAALRSLVAYGDDDLAAALAALEADAAELHRRAGIPADITRETLLDVGRKHELYGARAVLPWLLGLMRADVIQFGRLQVERLPDERGHGLHIPETGPLEPSVVDRSLGRIRAFTGPQQLHCTSWLLDPAVSKDLPGSNLASFAGRFMIVDGGEDSDSGNRSVAKFVFRTSYEAVLAEGGVTPRTGLERRVVERLRSGYRWSEPTGVIAGS